MSQSKKGVTVLMTLEQLTSQFENLSDRYDKLLLEGKKESETTIGMRAKTLEAYTKMSKAKEKLADAKRSAKVKKA